MKERLTACLLLTAICSVLTLSNVWSQRYSKTNDSDTLLIDRVSYPAYLSKQIQPTDMLIEKNTYEELLKKLDSPASFESKFAQLKAENDSLYNVTTLQMEKIIEIYNQTDRLQTKILNNDMNLIRTESEIANLKVKYNKALETIAAPQDEERVIRYRTRYIFRDKQEKRWFWTTWGIFIAVPSAVLLWNANR